MSAVRSTLLGLAVAAFVVLPETGLAQKRQRDVLTRSEIESSASKAGDLHGAIRGLRPHFLTPARGVRTLGNSITEPIAVYVDGTRQTGVDALKSIRAITVQEVRYLDPARAGNEFGSRANGGAIVVKLHKDQPPGAPLPAPTPPPPLAH